MEHVRLTATDVTWPGRQPARLDGEARVADGSHASLDGTFHPATLAADVRLSFEAVDVTRVRGYLTDRGRSRSSEAARRGSSTFATRAAARRTSMPTAASKISR